MYRIYPNLMKGNRRMWTCNRLDLQTLGFQLVMPKNLPDHCFTINSKHNYRENLCNHAKFLLLINNLGWLLFYNSTFTYNDRCLKIPSNMNLTIYRVENIQQRKVNNPPLIGGSRTCVHNSSVGATSVMLHVGIFNCSHCYINIYVLKIVATL